MTDEELLERQEKLAVEVCQRLVANYVQDPEVAKDQYFDVLTSIQDAEKDMIKYFKDSLKEIVYEKNELYLENEKLKRKECPNCRSW